MQRTDLLRDVENTAAIGTATLPRRRDNGCFVWGEVRDSSGKLAKLSIAGPNGYDLTVTASLGIAAHLMDRKDGVAGGYYTPSQLMGAEYVLGLPGVRRVE